jgi:hypothetical protein
MADFYGQREYPDEGIPLEAFADRFPDWVLGREIWRDWLLGSDWRDGGNQALDDLIGALREAFPSPSRVCPRVFVSHRQHDAAEALRIAWLAHGVGFEFWLDILNPQLRALAAPGSAPPPGYATLVASIIEVALLNCTHVIAALSDKTRGTLWVPYEYGRVKERRVYSQRVAVWLHPNIPRADIPEYTVLGVSALNEAAISGWLQSELQRWCWQTGDCCNGAGSPWLGGKTAALPT